MTNEELLSVAEIVDRLATRFHEQAADHERKLVEHRAAFGARTEADAKIIAGMRAERDGLLTQVQDMRAEIESLARECKAWELSTSEAWTNATANMLSVVFPEGRNIPENTALTNYQLFRTSMVDVAEEISRLHTERDGLRAEVAALQERLRASIARGDFAQMEVAALKSQTPKHPAKVGEWVRKTTDGLMYKTGEARRLVSYEIIKGEIWCNLEDGASWKMSVCEPCDPPTEATHDTPEGRSVVESVIRNDRNTEPRPGDTVRLVRIPSRSDVSPKLQTTLEWPWIERWGTLNQTALVVEPAYQLAGAVSVCLSANVHARWPICCVEVVRTEPDDIKVGDLVEVVSNRGRNTWLADVGSLGTVTSVEEINESISVCLDDVPGKQNALAGYVSLCDVRKVTT